jgi:predicted peptidase
MKRILRAYDHDLFEGPSLERRPTILFLHGVGECGTDLELVRRHGPAKAARLGEPATADNFLILSPQSAKPKWSSEQLFAFLGEAIDVYPIDESRIYLTGISMGGFGAWDLAIAHPEKFAAIAPICGGGDANRARILQDTPIWMFHSAKDPKVSVQRSDEMFAALQSCNAPVTYTRYSDLDHVATWEQAYGSSWFYSWFLAHSRPAAQQAAGRR